MKAADLAELIALAAIWGGSFLFMRMGAAEFGPVALAAIRVIGASLLLVPLWHARGQGFAWRPHWRPILLLGITNSALPFLCFAMAALSITAGLSAIFNAATPLFGAAIAWAWLRDRPLPWRIAGLVIGFAGVVGLVWNKASFHAGGSGWAIVACLAAAALYGFSANLTKKRLADVPPLAVAAGSQVAAAVVLAIPAAVWWPEAPPSVTAWVSAGLLAVFCTGLAYVMYFRLISHVGPANAISVTFLVPAFAVVWGAVFLGEAITPSMLIGCAVILLGTALATGLIGPRRRLRHVL